MPVVIQSISPTKHSLRGNRTIDISCNEFWIELMLYDVSGNIVVTLEGSSLWRVKTIIQALELAKAILLTKIFGYKVSEDDCSDIEKSLPKWLKEL